VGLCGAPSACTRSHIRIRTGTGGCDPPRHDSTRAQQASVEHGGAFAHAHTQLNKYTHGAFVRGTPVRARSVKGLIGCAAMSAKRDAHADARPRMRAHSQCIGSIYMRRGAGKRTQRAPVRSPSHMCIRSVTCICIYTCAEGRLSTALKCAAEQIYAYDYASACICMRCSADLQLACAHRRKETYVHANARACTQATHTHMHLQALILEAPVRAKVSMGRE
jgi:hypothetical protein